MDSNMSMKKYVKAVIVYVVLSRWEHLTFMALLEFVNHNQHSLVERK